MPTTPRNRVEQSGTVTHDHLTSWVTDGVIKDSGISAIVGTTAENLFDTAVLAAAATIPGSTTWLRTAGLVTVGDHGDSLYVKVLSSTPGGFQSADGAWWQPVIGSSSGGAGGFNTRVEAAAATIASSVETIQTEGGFLAGDGGGATYKRVAVQPAHSCWFQSADGAYWVPFTNTPTLNVRNNLATLDGVTDDLAAIQGTIDYVLYFDGAARPYIPSGTAIISNTIHVGYGSSAFKAGTLEGAGPSYLGIRPGTLIDASSFVNAPALNVQGARMGYLVGFTLTGANGNYIDAAKLDHLADAAVDDTSINNWVAPAILTANPDAFSSTAPNAGITLDAYAGSAPSPAYPAVTYPSFVSGGQYNKSVTSKLTMERIYINGFPVGYVNQPSGVDSQGEFILLRDSRISRCAVGYAICEFNARNNRLDNVDFFLVHTCLDNVSFGAGHGHAGGEWTNCSFTDCIQLFNLGLTQTTGGMRFSSCYGEQMWRIGSLSQGNVAVTFDDCTFSLGAHGFHGESTDSTSPKRGVPETIISNGGGSDQWINFIGGEVRDYYSVCVIDVDEQTLNIQGTHFRCISNNDFAYQQFARLFTCGGLVLKFLGGASPNSFNISFSNPFLGPPNSITGVQDVWVGGRGFPTPLYCRFHDGVSNFTGIQQVAVPYRANTIVGASYTAVVSSTPSPGLVLTMTFPSGGSGVWGPLPGDILQASNNKTIFFVRSVSPDGKTVTAVAQNNFHDPGWGAWDFISQPSINTGANNGWTVASSRFYTPTDRIWGDFTATSNVITNVHGVGNSATTADVTTGDIFYSNKFSDDLFNIGFADGGSLITNVNSGAGTITLSDNALVTRTNVRLGTFVRPGPALEASAFDPLVYGALVWFDVQDLSSLYTERVTSPSNTGNLIFQSNSFLTNPTVFGVNGWGFDPGSGDPLTPDFTLVQDQTGPAAQPNYAWRVATVGFTDFYQAYADDGDEHNWQIKVKAGSSVWLYMGIDSSHGAFFNANTGATGTVLGSGYSITSAAAGGGFFLITLLVPFNTTGNDPFFALSVVNGDNDFNAPANGTTVTICDIMVSSGSAPVAYAATGSSLWTTALIDGPVGGMVNKGILGGVWTAASDAQRPYLRSVVIGSDTRYYLDFSVNSGNAYLSAPSDVTLTSTTLSCAAIRRPAAAANTVVFGASAAATPHTVRWAPSNHLITALGDTAFDDGVAHVATGNHLLTDRRTAGNVQFTRLDKVATGNGAANAALTNKIDRLGVHNGTNSVGGFFAGAIFGADLAANVSTIEDYFGAIIGI